MTWDTCGHLGTKVVGFDVGPQHLHKANRQCSGGLISGDRVVDLQPQVFMVWLMTYVLVPMLTKVFQSWLQPGRPPTS